MNLLLNRNLKFQINQRAFTLVEMLVVLGIMAILTGLSVSVYRNFQNQNLVNNFAKEAVQTLRQTQNNSIATLQPTCQNVGAGFKTFQAWVVIFFADRLEVTKACVSSDPTPIYYFETVSGTYPPISKLPFPKGITTDAFSAGFGNAYCFLTPFARPSFQTVTITSDVVQSSQDCLNQALIFSTKTITITHSTSGSLRKICINPSGSIYDVEGLIICS